MPETNQLLINYYKKEEILDIIGEDYEPVIKESNVAGKDKNENILNTFNVTQNTPMEIARKYKKYFEEYKQNRKQICKEKNISNGTFQKYLRLNYLIPELQELVNTKKLGINSAEHISFLDKQSQYAIFRIIQNYDYEITDSVAKKIKIDYRKYKKLRKNYILSKDKMESYKNEKSLKIIFTQEEIDKYFLGLPNREIKEYIINILENTKDEWGIAYGKYRETKDRY